MTADRHAASERPALKLYVQGPGRRSTEAVRIVRSVCSAQLGSDGYDLRVIDIRESPDAAGADEVLAVPTLMSGARRIVGDIREPDVVELLNHMNLNHMNRKA